MASGSDAVDSEGAGAEGESETGAPGPESGRDSSLTGSRPATALASNRAGLQPLPSGFSKQVSEAPGFSGANFV